MPVSNPVQLRQNIDLFVAATSEGRTIQMPQEADGFREIFPVLQGTVAPITSVQQTLLWQDIQVPGEKMPVPGTVDERVSANSRIGGNGWPPLYAGNNAGMHEAIPRGKSLSTVVFGFLDYCFYRMVRKPPGDSGAGHSSVTYETEQLSQS